jgi:hypothetical protein
LKLSLFGGNATRSSLADPLPDGPDRRIELLHLTGSDSADEVVLDKRRSSAAFAARARPSKRSNSKSFGNFSYRSGSPRLSATCSRIHLLYAIGDVRRETCKARRKPWKAG